MDAQTIINIAAGAALSVMGWFARELWGAVKSLQKELHDMEILMSTHYVTREDYRSDMKDVKEMLGKIFDKLDNKVDK
jgi:hypothetical protein